MTFCNVKVVNGQIHFSDGTSRQATQEEVKYAAGRKLLLSYEDEHGTKRIVFWADLHRHSGYSIMDSSIRIKDMIQHTEYAGALTDHGNIRGSLEYYKAMKAAGKFPIIGEEFYVNSIDGKKDCNHLIIIAKTWKGYKNLVKLSSIAYSNFYKKPQVNYGMLQKYHEGLICSSACLGGELAKALRVNDTDRAEEVIQKCQSIFGDDYYLEIQRHGLAPEKTVNPGILALAKKHGIKVIATTDAHYTEYEDADIHQILLCDGTKSKLSEPKRQFSGSGYHLHSISEMTEKFKDVPEALDGTLEILQKCSEFEIKTGDIRTPDFPVPAPFASEEAYFDFLCEKGLKKRFQNGASKEEKERTEYEVSVIKQMKFCGYFLIVQDFINWAKDNKIPVGPGRGSAVGCIVAYILGITNINPLQYGLLFERFLNPERVSMPDIDSDFSKYGRSLVIEYIKKKYGAECVSKIIDITRLCAKVVIKDVCRVLDCPYSLGDEISKMIPEIPNITLDAAMEQNPQLLSRYKSDPKVKRIWDYAKRLEGLPRGVSVHACGILIAPSEVSDYMPQELATDRETGEKSWVTQYPGPQCEEMGLLKMDFLGLRTLDAIDETINTINAEMKQAPGWKPLTFENIPINDAKSYQLLKRKHTGGVFQMESDGMKSLLNKMYYDVKADDPPEKGNEYFERLIATVALYRPGPMDEIPQFLESMTTGKIKYDTPKLKVILQNTYGVLVYQEQAMMAVRELAGFSKGQSDIIRKGMAKKKKAILDEYGEYFLHGSQTHDATHPKKPLNIAGCTANGISEDVAKTIWDKMEKFGAYAFNKSHACAYALLAVKTAWLSRYYPAEFFKATMDSYIDNANRLAYYAAECKGRSISLLLPSINKSETKFSIEKNGKSKMIRFPLNAIKGVGDVVSEAIVENRKDKGMFVSFDNLLMRMSPESAFTGSALEKMNNAGALDEFEGTRSGRDAVMTTIGDKIKLIRSTDFDQLSLFDTATSFRIPPTIIPKVPEYSKGKLAEKEQEAIGFIFNWPTIEIKDFVKRKGREILNINAIKRKQNLNKNFKFVGLIKDVKEIKFHNGGGMLKIIAEDETGEIECISFSSSGIILNKNIVQGSVCYMLATLKVSDKYGIQVELKNSTPMEQYLQKEEIKKAI